MPRGPARGGMESRVMVGLLSPLFTTWDEAWLAFQTPVQRPPVGQGKGGETTQSRQTKPFKCEMV